MELVKQSIDFESIGTKLQSGEKLNDAEKSAVFSIALGYTKKLIQTTVASAQSLIPADKDMVGKYMEAPQAVKDYIPGALLGRIVDLHKRAVDSGSAEAEAFIRFIELKERVSEKLLADSDELQDERLNDLIDERSKRYMDRHFSAEIRENVNIVREMLRIAVANNPTTQPKGMKYTLD